MATNTYKNIPSIPSQASVDAKANLSGAVFTGNIDVDNANAVRFFELDANGSNKITVKAPDSLAADWTLTLPANDGDNLQVLQTNGSGVTSWVAQSSGASAWATYTPTVTLVGGAGNTVPVYTTNSGRYLTVGKIVFVKLFLDGDGGAEGAGTGELRVALPVAPGTNHRNTIGAAAYLLNNTDQIIFSQVHQSLAVLRLFKNVALLTPVLGSDQNNTSRGIQAEFSYEID